MAIHRAGTYPVHIKTPVAPSEYSKIRVTFAQNQRILIEKTNGDTAMELTDDAVIVTLTQEETKLFAPTYGSPLGGQEGTMAFMQIRCYKNTLDAPASEVWPIPVYDSLYTEVMS